MNPIPWYVKDAVEVSLKFAVGELAHPPESRVDQVLDCLLNAQDSLAAVGRGHDLAACQQYTELVTFLVGTVYLGMRTGLAGLAEPAGSPDTATLRQSLAQLRLAGPGPVRSVLTVACTVLAAF